MRAEAVVRDAEHDDVAPICQFGEAHIRSHYAPLIGAEAADEQVRSTRQLPDDTDRLCIEHFVATERAGAFYQREGFTVERIGSRRTEDPALGVVWRSRHLPPLQEMSGQA